MVTVVGKDQSVVKRVTCRSCAAVLEYNDAEVRERHGTDYSGGPDGAKWVVCPNCGKDAIIKSW